MKVRLYFLSATILAIGLASGILIYVTTTDAPGTGHVLYDSPQLSKKYIRELERFGGKQAVIFDEIIRWLEARFSGKALGVTIGWLSALAALALFLFARWLPPDSS